MALDPAPASAGKQLEPAIESLHELRRAQCDDSGGSQFDRQRHTVESLTDLDHSGGVVVGKREVVLDVSGPLDEQTHRIGVHQLVDGLTSVAQCERGQGDQLLAADGDPFAAGSQDDHAWAFAFNASDPPGHRSQ